MTEQSNAAPFLFRNKKLTLTTRSKSFDVTSPIADGIAIVNVEENDQFRLISANEKFLENVYVDDEQPVGSLISEIFWGENIEENQLQAHLLKSYNQKKARAFIWLIVIDGVSRSFFCKIIPLQNNEGIIDKITLTTSDYDETEQLEIEVGRYNYVDTLTELPNRFQFLELLEEKYGSSSRLKTPYDDPNIPEAAVLFVNINKLQSINENYGYDIGDNVLKAVAVQLKDNLADNTLLARFTNDKFVIFITDEHFENVKQEAQVLAQSIHHNVTNLPSVTNNDIRLSLSIGIATGPASPNKLEQLMQDAHMAMRRTKNNIENQTIIFNQDLKSQVESKLKLETEFREALKRNALELHYQPLVNLQNGVVCGFEALARWNNSQRGNISPLEFIALAEEVGLIIPLGEWALNTACQQLKNWIDTTPSFYNMFMAVNISSTHIIKGNIMALTRDALAKSGLDGGCLKLELTESTIMENSDIARNILLDLKTLGISLAVDDFGTGYSSLSYLSRIPADTLKIDRSFTSRIDTSDEGYNIVKVIISLAKSLGMTVIAEGIETKEQMNKLKNLGCHFGQGYLFSKPMPADKVPQFIKNHPAK